MADTDYVQMAYLLDLLRMPVLRSAIEALRLPMGSRGLDEPDYYAFFTYSMFQGRVAVRRE